MRPAFVDPYPKEERVDPQITDYALLSSPLLNKGMAFTEEERSLFHLHGLLPPGVATIEEQEQRSYNALLARATPLEKYSYLRDLQDSNETLFYFLVTRHLEEVIPLIYTPVVGEGCLQFSKIYRRPRGLFLSYPNRNRLDEILANPRFDKTAVIVVSDGERILGLGDLGAGGMGIPIGKLSLYTACSGIHPETTLPILLDVGTDNPHSLQDPLYVGWRHERVRGKDYDDFLETFVTAVHKRFPHVLLQWEDFAKHNASSLLERYHNRLCSFNDDIQGTAAVTVGALLAALQTPLAEQKIVIAGGGSAGCGIAQMLLLILQRSGLNTREALSRLFLFDQKGLFTEGRNDLLPFQKQFTAGKLHPLSLEESIEKIHPTVLIGVSGQAGLFTEAMVKEMARHAPRPILFPLSNPLSHAEALPSDILRWTEGRALISTGSPSPPVIREGKTLHIDQTNNVYIFPGLGLGALAAKARCISDGMLLKAAETLAANAPKGRLLPPLHTIRTLSLQIAKAVAQEAIDSHLAPPSPTIDEAIHSLMWTPAYRPYTKA